MAVNPPSGTTAGGTLVTVTGSGFTGATSVTFGGLPGTSLSVTNNAQLTVVTPAHAAGAVPVVVNGPSGASNATVMFTYGAVGVVNPTFINPPSGPTTGFTQVTIGGSGLTGATSVTFGGVPGTGLVSGGDSSLTVFTPAHIAGPVSVVVNATGGASNGLLTFTYTGTGTVNPTFISPSFGPTAGGTQVTITGTGLSGATSVTFGGSAGYSLVPVSDTTLTVYTPTHAPGAVPVVVYTFGGGASNGALTFTYTGASTVNPTYITPSSGTTAGGTFVTIGGSGLSGAYSVTFGGVAGTSLVVNSDSSLTVYTPAHLAGAVAVIVSAAGGTSNGALTYTYTTGVGVPVVTSVSPTSGPTVGGTTVTVYGAGFTGATSVTFGGSAGTSVTIQSDGQLTVVSPAHSAGVVDVLVANIYGTSTNTTADNFTYTSSVVATITGISPSSAAPGTTVTITGTGFTGATSVTFGGVAGTGLAVVNDNQLTVIVPSYSPGTVDVIVITPAGSSATSSVARFTVTTPAGATFTLTLNFRWSLVVWMGQDGMAVTTALRGLESPDNPATNDVSAQVTVIFRWSGGLQKWEANYPGSNLPGVNDFTTLQKGVAYFISIAGPNTVTWTAITG